MNKCIILIFCIFACISSQAQNKRLDGIYETVEKAAKAQRWNEVYSGAQLYISKCDTTIMTFCYSKMVAYLAEYAARNLDYNKAIELGHKVVAIRRAALDSEPRHTATALNALAVYCFQAGYYDEAIVKCEEAIAIFEENKLIGDKQCAVAMLNMSTFLCRRGNDEDFRRALSLSEQSEKKIKKNTTDHLALLNNLAVCYYLANRFADSEKVGKKALKLGKKMYENNPMSYAVMLSNHMVRLADMKAFSQALTYIDESKKAFDAANAHSTLQYASFLINCGRIYTACDKYNESEQALVRADSILSIVVSENHADRVACISELAELYNKKGDRANMEMYERKLRELVDNSDSGNSRSADLAEKLAATMASKGNYTQAIIIEQSAADIYRSIGKTSEQAYAMKRLADYYIMADSFQVAADISHRALRLIPDETSANRNDILNTLAMAFYHLNDVDSARIYAEKAVKSYCNTGDTLTTAYSKTLSNLALYTYSCADTLNAVKYAQKALHLQMGQLGEDNPDNVATYYNMSYFCNDFDNARTAEYYHRALELQTSVVRNNFSYLTSAEREAFWNTKSYVYKAAPTLVYLHPTNDSILVDAYNAQLFTKGLLLNSEINFVNLLKNAGDSTVLAKYERFELLRRDIDAAYATNVPDRAARIATLNQEASELEEQLITECRQFGDFMAKLEVDYHDISDSLGDDEAAVEFMNLYIEGVGDTYLALYLRHGWETPRCSKLFNQAQLDNIGWTSERLSHLFNNPQEIDSLYRDERFGQLVWQPLIDNLDGVKTLYFAPAGIFYQLGAEYLAVDSVRVMADVMKCHRLSSTSLIASNDEEQKKYDKAALFGGFNYDMTKEEIIVEWDKWKFQDMMTERYGEPSELNDFDLLALVADSLAFRDLSMMSKVPYLPGTLLEMETIGRKLMEHDIETDMFVGYTGLESHFKTLSGKHNDIIHIATHGFALSETDLYNKQGFQLVLNENLRGNPLSRSGLIFAGANYTLSGGTLPQGIDNGVLTAREISLLDLSGTNLVVLSACRSGMGEVRDDGVFGLQRGFKKAGSKTLLMSLWNVADYATEQLMELFYENVINGKSKYDALAGAIQSLRSTPELNRPSYWAAFIMLDDL